MATTKCRSPECDCLIVRGDAYCSPYCESRVGESLPEDPCRCGHDACRRRARKSFSGRARAADPDEVAKPVVLVTGSSGFIGRALTESLAKRYTVVGLDVRTPEPGDASGIDFDSCDVTSEASVSAALDAVRRRHGDRLASVVHLAADDELLDETGEHARKVALTGLSQMLGALQSFEAEQFVYPSTVLVMRPAAPGVELREASPTDASWHYPRTKREAERVLAEQHGSIPAVLLRIAAVYDDAGHSIELSRQIRSVYENRLDSLIFPGNRSHGRPFVHLDDLVRCLRATIDRRAELPDFELLLVGEPTVPSYAELQERIRNMLPGAHLPTVPVPKRLVEAGAWIVDKLSDETAPAWRIDSADAHYPISIDRATDVLEWRPRHGILATLPRIITRLLSDPRAWYDDHDLEWDGRTEGALGT